VPVALAVMLGGALGALARYGLDSLIEHRAFSVFPWSTFLINVSGCFVAGAVVAALVDRHHLPPALRVGIVVGFLGAYTTFATFEQETVDLQGARLLRRHGECGRERRRGDRSSGRGHCGRKAVLAANAVFAELEDEEVALHHLHGDVIDRHLADPAFEGATMGVAVQDDVGTTFADRRRHPVRPEEGPDDAWLALQGRCRGRVVKQDDAMVAAGDLLQATVDRLDLGGRVAVDLAQDRLAEVR
jgi:protein CrcB